MMEKTTYTVKKQLKISDGYGEQKNGTTYQSGKPVKESN